MVYFTVQNVYSERRGAARSTSSSSGEKKKKEKGSRVIEGESSGDTGISQWW